MDYNNIRDHRADDKRRLADKIERVLWQNILPAHFPLCHDKIHGGFHEYFSMKLERMPRKTKFLVFQARMTWTAAAAALACADITEREKYKNYALHGLHFLADSMWNTRQGGFIEYIYNSGCPIFSVMPWTQLYSYAFGIFAAATVYRATGDQKALALSLAAFDWLDRRAHDDRYGGYFEHIRQDGAPVALEVPPKPIGRGLLVIGRVGYKSMNAHIHLLEALCALRQIVDDSLVTARLQETFNIIRDKIILSNGQLNMFSQRDFKTRDQRGSFGHQLEIAYILHETSMLLHHRSDEKAVPKIQATVEHALQWGWDEKHGGFYEEGPVHGMATQKNKVWWVQLEAMNGLLAACELFPHKKIYFQRFVETWNFFHTYMIDSQYGGCFDTVSPEGKPLRTDKTTQWKAAYHITRALLFAIQELRKPPV